MLPMGAKRDEKSRRKTTAPLISSSSLTPQQSLRFDQFRRWAYQATTSYGRKEPDYLSMVLSSSLSSSSSCASLSSLEDVSVKICNSVKFLCSYGGRIIPCYPDGRLRYIGGETRVLSVHRSTSFSDLQSKLGELCGWETVNLRCQIPKEDLDALVSITSDEDLTNLMEEYDFASREGQRQLKVRAFLYPTMTKSSKSATPLETPIPPIFSKSKAPVRPTLIHSGVSRCASPARFYGPVCKAGGYLRFHGHPASGCCLAAAHRRVIHHGN